MATHLTSAACSGSLAQRWGDAAAGLDLIISRHEHQGQRIRHLGCWGRVTQQG